MAFLIPVFIFGLIVGSFVNVLILRFGFEESSRHRSGCQSCGTELSWFELIPVVSFFALGGHCRTCGSRMSLQYPIVEFAAGVIAVLSVVVTPLGGSSVFPAVALSVGTFMFFLTFLMLAVYDTRHTLVPLPFVCALALSALFLALSKAFVLESVLPLGDALLGALVLGGAFAILRFLTKGHGMGEGDIYIALSIGVAFGLGRGVEVITVAFWAGALAGLLLIAKSRVQLPEGSRVRMKSELPFVPFLFLASLVGAFTTFSPFAFVSGLVALL